MSFKIHRRSLLGWLAGMFSWRVLEALPASVPIFRKRSFLVPLVDAQGNINRTYPASAMSYAEDLGAGVTLEMGLIPGGKFDMGSTSDEPPSYGQEQPIHSVSMKPFLLGAFPVTVAQWRRMASLPQVDYRLYTPAVFLDPNLPIDIVGRLTAVEFCKRLRVLTGRPYRLPSEAEWEYACRAGTTTKYHFGDGISQAVCNYNDGMTRPVAKTLVGSKNAPNRFGLHDMHGNVFEPCRDYLHMTYDGAPTDGSAWLDGEDDILRYHVSRGGCFFFGPDAARSAYRWQISLESAGGYGMRVALDTDVSLMDPQVDPGAIANAASSIASGEVSPGQVIVIGGGHVGPETAAAYAVDDQGRVPSLLSGTRVLFDGVAAPILSADVSRLAVVVPYEVAGQQTTQMIVERDGQTSSPITLTITDSSPAIFTAESIWGSSLGGVKNEDGSTNSDTNAAAPGSVIVFRATGEGMTNPPGVTGLVASGVLPAPILVARVEVGGVEAAIDFIGGEVGQVAGVLKVQARLGVATPLGRQAVVLTIGSARSQGGVYIVLG